MNNGIVSRGAEKTLGVIGIIFNLLTIGLFIFAILSLGSIQNTTEFQQFEDEIRNDPTFASPEDAQLFIDTFVSSFGVVGWILVGLLAISTIFAILAVVNLRNDRNAKLAGIFFIVAGLFAGLLSLTSILFYIAAIMCFVRRSPKKDDRHLNDDYNGRDDDARYKEEQRIREEERIRQEERLRQEEQRRQNNNNEGPLHKDDDTYRPL